MIPGVGCGVAIWRDGRLLLLKRLKGQEAGRWNIPGGRIEFGERAADAARREVFEELGVEIELTRSLGWVENFADGQHWVSPIFAAAIVAGEPVNAEPSKHEAILWADPAHPPAPLGLAARTALSRA